MVYDLELSNISKVYDNGTTAVQNFDLQVKKGEFISFVGPSGCGKSTTLRMIAGFESISGGDISIRGKRINELPPEKRPTSTIFQNYALFPHLTVRENIEYGLSVKGSNATERRKKSTEIMDKLELLDIADRKTEGLSGGQRQRIALARGLVVEPDILLLDEPLGSLDANLRKSIQNELKLLQSNLGITFIFVTHDQSEALILSDRVIVMNSGMVEQISPPYELYTRPKTAFVANFIGRNTLLQGTLESKTESFGRITTDHGLLKGLINDTTLNKKGESTVLVIPSEAFDVYPRSEDMKELISRYDGNVLEGRVVAADVVGHTAFYKIDLHDGLEVNIESHISKYEETFNPGKSLVYITWNPEEATVIRSN